MTADDAKMKAGDYLFADASLGSLQEELSAVFEKKEQTFRNLGEEARAALYRKAYEIARAHLAACLGEEMPTRC